MRRSRRCDRSIELPCRPASGAGRRSAGPRGADPASDVEQEVHHVAILDDVFLAFGPHLASILGPLFALVLDEILERDGLRAADAAFAVAVDHAGGLRGGVANVDGPGAHFLDAGG